MSLRSLYLVVFVGCISSSSLFAQQVASENKWFTDLKDALSEPEQVYKLDLSGQDLEEIPAELKLFPNLDGLKLIDNHISEIGTELSENTRLEFLDLSGNQIKNIDFDMLANSGLNLTSLVLRENLLENIDESINMLKFLSHLDLGGNFIETFDESINLRYLKYLVLDNNNIQELPAIISSSRKLKSLNLNANNIEVFDLRVMESLVELDLGDNPLKKYNITISKLEKLILDWVDFNYLELYPLPLSIENLSLENCKLESIPDFIFKLHKLEELSLMYNDIHSIDQSIENCAKLKLLYLHGNKLDESKLNESSFNFLIER